MSLPSVRPLLLAVSNRHLFASDDVSALAYLVEWAGRVARAGIDLLQIRERGLDDVVLVRVVRSVHAAHEARAVAASGGADYLTFGTVFESASKAPGHPISGVRRLADACGSAGIPILAIGGVTLDRVPMLMRAG